MRNIAETNPQSTNLPEILAPAGSREAFFAAVNSGADAVYLAGTRFGARAYAANFAVDELAELIRYAHLRGVAVYVAVNTLLTDDELPEAVDFCCQLYQVGADALIVQDMGLVAALSAAYPQIPLNASTQMTLHNSAGVRAMETYGFHRAILAREVSLDDIRSICAKSAMEIEVFAHGALCICFSGQCLFSSLVGGRSGNRGRCAQPCRLKYQLLDKNGEVCGSGHLLSPKDLNTIDLLPQLTEAGVVSLKLEGRMKRPEYVATVTAAYAAAKQGQAYDERALLQAFNRGFTQAYLQAEPGADLMSYERPNNRGTRLGRIEKIERDALILKLEAPLLVGDGLEIWVSKGGRQGFEVKAFDELGGGRVRLPLAGLPVQTRYLSPGDRVFKTSDSALNSQGESVMQPQDNLPLMLEFCGKLGAKPQLKATYGAVSAAVCADYEIPQALNRPADWALLEKQLGRLGGSGWRLASLTGELDEGVMLPASVLNNLRRDAVQALEDKLLLPYQRAALPAAKSAKALKSQPTKLNKGRKQAALAVLVDNLAAAESAVAAGADYIYWCAWRGRFQPQPTADDLRRLAALGKPIFAQLPVMALESELPLWRRRLAQYRDAGFEGVLAGNPWALQLLADMGWQPQVVADFGLNCFNAAAAGAYQKRGCGRIALSRELNGAQLKSMAAKMQGKAQTEVQIFGNLQVMNSRHCPIGAICGGKLADNPCAGACRAGGFRLRDEKGFAFPVFTDEFCRSYIYNGHQLCLLEEVAQLAAEHDVLRLDLLHYRADKVAKITEIYRDICSSRVDDELLAAYKTRLAAICGAGLTKGHYYRGVE